MPIQRRVPTPAMLAHLRRIAALGGKATSKKYGGYAAPHAARRASSSSRSTASSTAKARASKTPLRTTSSTRMLPRTLGLPPGSVSVKTSPASRTATGGIVKLPKLRTTRKRASARPSTTTLRQTYRARK